MPQRLKGRATIQKISKDNIDAMTKSFGDNEPYSVTDASDYTIPVHGVQIPAHRGQSFRRIADSVPVIADSF